MSGTALVNTVTTPDARTTTFGYDSAGRVNSKEDNASKFAYFQYDAAGNLTYQWGDTVNPVYFEYNDANQRTKMHTYRSGMWTSSSLPTGSTGFGGTSDLTTWNYKAGLLDSKTDNSGLGTSYQYYDTGLVKQRTDARGWVTTYAYDGVNRLQSVTYGTGASAVTTNLGYTYTRAGQLKTVTDATGSRTFSYYDSGTNANGVTQANPDGVTDDSSLLNKSDRLQSEALDATWYGGHTLTYTYNYGVAGKANGSISGLSLNTATAYGVAYDYDSVLRLNKLTYNNGTPFDYSYVTNSNLVDTVTHGASAYLDYDYEAAADRLATVKASWGGIAPVETRVTRKPNVPLIDTEITQGSDYLNAIGRSALAGVDTDFSYTDRYEITSSGKYPANSDWTVSSTATELTGTDRAYPYDSFGNRSSTTSPVWTPNALNQYTATPSSSTYQYDANGNMTSDGTRTYAYDAENRLISVTQGSSTWTYVYDYLGRRVQKSGTGIATTKYLYDGWNLIAELDGNATITRRFVWGLDAAGSLTAAGGVGGLLQIDADGTNEYYPIYDASFNVLGLYDGTGSIANGAAYEYDPFGNVETISSGTYAAANPFRSATKYTDAETGLVYYGRRYYSPTLGRFINRDPAEEQGGLNLYAYCLNDGVNRYDPLGLTTQDDARKAAEAAARQAAEQARQEAEKAARDKAWNEGGFWGIVGGWNNGTFDAAGNAAYQQTYDAYSFFSSFATGGPVAPKKDLDALFRSLDKNGNGYVNIATEIAVGFGMDKAKAERIKAWQRLVAAGYGSRIGYPGDEAAFFASLIPRASDKQIAQMLAGGVVVGTGLTAAELAQIKAIANKYNTVIDIVGSRAEGTARNIDTDLPVGRGPNRGPNTRSDIDFRIDASHPQIAEIIKELKEVGNGAGSASTKYSTSERPTYPPAIRIRPGPIDPEELR